MTRAYSWTKGSTPPELRILRRLRETYGLVDWSGCWIWPGARRSNDEYGCVLVGSRSAGDRRTVATHVVMWEAAHGPVPEGYELHHRCMTPLCCHPFHLTPVTHRRNCTLVTEATKDGRRERLVYARAVLAGARASEM